ncbi:MAG: acyl carrier protein [Bacteroidota bacterium]
MSNDPQSVPSVAQVVHQHLEKVSKKPFGAEDHLREDLGLDSIRLVSVVTRLTGALKVSILSFSDRDLIGLNTVGDVVRLFEAKIQTQSS